MHYLCSTLMLPERLGRVALGLCPRHLPVTSEILSSMKLSRKRIAAIANLQSCCHHWMVLVLPCLGFSLMNPTHGTHSIGISWPQAVIERYISIEFLRGLIGLNRPQLCRHKPSGKRSALST